MKAVQEYMLTMLLEEIEEVEALGTGGLDPTDAELTSAPLLEQWWLEERLFDEKEKLMSGAVFGHSELGDRDITIKPIHVDLRRGWVQTNRLLFRLGKHV